MNRITHHSPPNGNESIKEVKETQCVCVFILRIIRFSWMCFLPWNASAVCMCLHLSVCACMNSLPPAPVCLCSRGVGLVVGQMVVWARLISQGQYNNITVQKVIWMNRGSRFPASCCGSSAARGKTSTSSHRSQNFSQERVQSALKWAMWKFKMLASGLLFFP